MQLIEKMAFASQDEYFDFLRAQNKNEAFPSIGLLGSNIIDFDYLFNSVIVPLSIHYDGVASQLYVDGVVPGACN